MLRLLAQDQPVTRAAAARQLGLSSGSAAEIVQRLRALDLMGEGDPLAAGRGRPSPVLTAHEAGPLVLAVDIGYEGWRAALAGLDGRIVSELEGRHEGRTAEVVLPAVRAGLRRFPSRTQQLRVAAVAVSVTGTVRGTELMQAATLRWRSVDLTALDPGFDAPLVAGNNATLAAVSEARTGAGRHGQAVLHLMVDVGVGGALVVNGLPQVGATGAGGEFGHLPLGDLALECPCGARGCWDLEVDGRALARHLGGRAPRRPVSYARAVLQKAAEGDRSAQAAVEVVAGALARGLAGVVNATDPDVVTLGGLGWSLRSAAPAVFDGEWSLGLMRFRRDDPPAVVQARYLDDGALQGALAMGTDVVLSEAGVQRWASTRGGA